MTGTLNAEQKTTNTESEEVWKENLARAFGEGLDGRPWLDSNYGQLKAAVDSMRELGLRSHDGRTLSELKRQLEYFGRVFYTQRVEVSIEGTSPSSAPGMPSAPCIGKGPKIWFTVRSLDNQRGLLAILESWQSRTLTLVPGQENELGMNLGFLEAAGPGLTLHRNGKGDDPCWIHSQGSGYDDCRYRTYDRELTNQVAQAYNQGGQDAVFAILDRLWIDLIAARPMKQALSQEALRIRGRLHQGHPVRVFLAGKQSHIGTFKQVKAGKDGLITSIQIVPIGQKRPISIEVGEIMELLPCRPESETLQP